MVTLRANTSLNSIKLKGRGALAFLLLVELIPVKEMKRLAHPRLRRVIVEAVCCSDSRTSESVEDLHASGRTLRKGLLHNVTQSIEVKWIFRP